MSEGKRVRAVWGAKGIGEVVGVSPRRAFELLERGILPARKRGGLWQSTIEELEEFMLGRQHEAV
jgi:hypothetical protein